MANKSANNSSAPAAETVPPAEETGAPVAVDLAEAPPAAPPVVEKKKRNRVGIAAGRQTLIDLANKKAIHGEPGSYSIAVVVGDGIEMIPVKRLEDINYTAVNYSLAKILHPASADTLVLKSLVEKAKKSGMSEEQLAALLK